MPTVTGSGPAPRTEAADFRVRQPDNPRPSKIRVIPSHPYNARGKEVPQHGPFREFAARYRAAESRPGREPAPPPPSRAGGRVSLPGFGPPPGGG